MDLNLIFESIGILADGVLLTLALTLLSLAIGFAVSVPLSFFALTLAYMIMSVTDNVFASTQNQVYYWALAGMTVAISQTSSAKVSRKAGDRPRTAVRGIPRAVPKAAGA